MPKCKFKTEIHGRIWECPLEALPGEEYCYWHIQEASKKPTEKQIKELRKFNIRGVYLYGAILHDVDLHGINLQNSHLSAANFRNVDLSRANLQDSNLSRTVLTFANLYGTNFQNARLYWTNLKSTYLSGANLQNTKAWGANFQNSDLHRANLHGADFYKADLQKTNFYMVSITREINLSEVKLHYANLYKSYIDQTPTLRDAELFNEDTWMEINEIVAELAKRRMAIDLEKLRDVHEELARNLESEGYFYYVTKGEKVVLFDPEEGLLEEPDRFIQWKFRTKKALALEEILENKENSERLKKKRELENQLRGLLKEHGEEILYESTPENLQRLYEASYEVYNKLYYFYLQNGKLEEALQMHYRRNEVRRKLRLTKGLRSKIRAYLYDWLVLKVLTGYGIKPERPLIFSLFTILVFAFLFRLTNGIVKVVDGKPVPADWVDYLYHSVITFTSLGYANIQPNLTSHVPQVLVSIESFLGLLLMSLFLYTVTFRISR